MKYKIDRASVMKDAHKRYRDGKRLNLNWTFGRCLQIAWYAAKQRRDQVREYYQPPVRKYIDRPFPKAA